MNLSDYKRQKTQEFKKLAVLQCSDGQIMKDIPVKRVLSFLDTVIEESWKEGSYTEGFEAGVKSLAQELARNIGE